MFKNAVLSIFEYTLFFYKDIPAEADILISDTQGFGYVLYQLNRIRNRLGLIEKVKEFKDYPALIAPNATAEKIAAPEKMSTAVVRHKIETEKDELKKTQEILVSPLKAGMQFIRKVWGVGTAIEVNDNIVTAEFDSVEKN